MQSSAQYSDAIRSLAHSGARSSSISPTARQMARRTILCPVDYMRCAEFDALLRQLQLSLQMTVLDVSSPQWFSMFLAKQHPDVVFHYINIVANELDPYRELARANGIGNLDYQIADARKLPFHDNSFDRVVSISVLEHIYPAEGGDVQALKEISRVLRPGGELLLTVPYKEKANIVYADGPVYERSGQAQNFFAREYDESTFADLLTQSGLTLIGKWFICEKPSAFAVDYCQWGPGKGTAIAKVNITARKLARRLFRISLDELLAKRYLVVSDTITDRVVNVAAALRKA